MIWFSSGSPNNHRPLKATVNYLSGCGSKPYAPAKYSGTYRDGGASRLSYVRQVPASNIELSGSQNQMTILVPVPLCQRHRHLAPDVGWR